jgi:hypothetical protein
MEATYPPVMSGGTLGGSGLARNLCFSSNTLPEVLRPGHAALQQVPEIILLSSALPGQMPNFCAVI